MVARHGVAKGYGGHGENLSCSVFAFFLKKNKTRTLFSQPDKLKKFKKYNYLISIVIFWKISHFCAAPGVADPLGGTAADENAALMDMNPSHQLFTEALIDGDLKSWGIAGQFETAFPDRDGVGRDEPHYGIANPGIGLTDGPDFMVGVEFQIKGD